MDYDDEKVRTPEKIVDYLRQLNTPYEWVNEIITIVANSDQPSYANARYELESRIDKKTGRSAKEIQKYLIAQDYPIDYADIVSETVASSTDSSYDHAIRMANQMHDEDEMVKERSAEEIRKYLIAQGYNDVYTYSIPELVEKSDDPSYKHAIMLASGQYDEMGGRSADQIFSYLVIDDYPRDYARTVAKLVEKSGDSSYNHAIRMANQMHDEDEKVGRTIEDIVSYLIIKGYPRDYARTVSKNVASSTDSSYNHAIRMANQMHDEDEMVGGRTAREIRDYLISKGYDNYYANTISAFIANSDDPYIRTYNHAIRMANKIYDEMTRRTAQEIRDYIVNLGIAPGDFVENIVRDIANSGNSSYLHARNELDYRLSEYQEDPSI